jgi:hypothetical protein
MDRRRNKYDESNEEEFWFSQSNPDNRFPK